MIVLLPEGVELQGFEKELKTALEQAKLAGYALMGFDFREVLSPRLHAIDAVVIMEPGVFVCLEAKGYKGKWTGNGNEKWLCDNQEIKSVGLNPYKQVEQYSLVVKNKLQSAIFQNIQFWVNFFIVAPDKAEFKIEGAVINTFQPGKAIQIFNVSRTEQILGSIRANERVAEKFNEVGIKKIISELVGISLNNLEELINKQVTKIETSINAHLETLPKPSTSIEPISETVPEPPISTEPNLETILKTPIAVETPSQTIHDIPIAIKHSSEAISEQRIPIVTSPETIVKQKTPINPPITKIVKPGKLVSSSAKVVTKKPVIPKYIYFLCLVGLGLITAGHHFWNKRPCENNTETRVDGACYKDITKKPIIVGIITSPEQYLDFKTYLKEQLGSQAIDVVVEGNSKITYQEAQENIAKYKWDIVFANSPMNGMRAKESNYKWLARMYPKYPLTYQSALFVRDDSLIRSIGDVKSTTKIALGDFNSASSFYIPVYDLYGKSLTVTAGYRSAKIRELVASKQVDIGAVVYSNIKDDPQFRVIQVSKEIPGTGVYLSPKLTPIAQKRIQNLLENASKKIKEQANYDLGEEPDYKELKAIAIRTEQVLSCANFKINPVQFFCNPKSQSILGRIAGFTNQDNQIIRLRLEQDNHKVCQVFVPLQTLSTIESGNSAENINRKQVKIANVEPIQLEDGTCQITIENSSQLVVVNN